MHHWTHVDTAIDQLGACGLNIGHTRLAAAGRLHHGVGHIVIAEFQQRKASEVASREIELRERRAAVLATQQISAGFRYVSLSLAQNAGTGSGSGGMPPGLYLQVLDAARVRRARCRARRGRAGRPVSQRL